MLNTSKDFFNILKSKVFLNLMNTSRINIAELNAAITLLIKSNIDFDVIFTSGTNRLFPQAILTIFINPNTNIDFIFGKAQPDEGI
ncbi:MAG: hypothetical protein MJA82_07355 [Clostridia bacterium]|nr:hypothetical protein [Clostridia bacterium]